MLRRLKADHVTLPAKVEAVLYVPLTRLQREWYRAVLERDARQLGAASARSLNNVLASLRNCCNHPYLFDGAEPEPFVEGEHLAYYTHCHASTVLSCYTSLLYFLIILHACLSVCLIILTNSP